MTRTIVIMLLLAGTCSAQYIRRGYPQNNGRICSNGNCAMCNRLESQYLATHQPKWNPVVQQPIVVQPLEYKPGYFGGTQPEAISQIVALLDLTPYDTLVDIGCGDARVLIAAVQATGCTAVGYEIQPSIAALARRNVNEAGLSQQIKIIEGDSTKIAQLSSTVVYSYMWESITDRMAGQLKRAKRVVSYHHRLPLPASEATIDVAGKPAMVYIWQPEAADFLVAVYGTL